MVSGRSLGIAQPAEGAWSVLSPRECLVSTWSSGDAGGSKGDGADGSARE